MIDKILFHHINCCLFYRFSLDTRINGTKFAVSGSKDTKLPGTSHADDLFYVFYQMLAFFIRKITESF